MKRILDFFTFVDRIFAAIVESMLVIVLLAMVLLVASQVILRNLFEGNIQFEHVDATLQPMLGNAIQFNFSALPNIIWWIGLLLAISFKQYIAIKITQLTTKKPGKITLNVLSLAIGFVLAMVIIFLVILILIVAKPFLHNIFNGGIQWADVAARHMVLWIALLGAMLATRSRQHVAIDAVTRFVPKKLKNSVRIVIDAFACVVAFFLAQAAWDFVLEERSMGTELFAGIPTWVAQTIIPFGFAMISLEYAIGIGLDIWRLSKDSNHVAGRGR